MRNPPRVLLNLAIAAEPEGPLRRAAAAAAAGCDGVGFADSPRLFGDPFLHAQEVLAGTDVALAGPCVAALGLRPPATVAAALSTLAARYPDRVLAVVGRGESSVHNEGLPVPGLRAHRRALADLRDRLAEAPADPPAVLLGAASGPRTITETAAALGGVLLDVGVEPDVLGQAITTARRAAPDTDVWLFLRAAITTSPAEQAAAAEPIVGSCAARLVAAPDWYRIDPADLPEVARVAKAHDYRRHGSAEARGGRPSSADALVRERFVLTGSAEHITERLRPVATLGVSGVILAGAIPGVHERIGELVPALRTALDPGRRA